MVFITIGLFLIYPILTIPLIIIGSIKDKKHRIIYMMLLAFDLALISLHLDPSKYGLDLNVYFSTMDIMKQMRLESFLQTYVTQKEFLTNILFYIYASLGNYNLWTFTVTFLCYGIFFYILTDYAKVKDISNKNYIVIMVVSLLFYNNLYAITGLRNSLAMMIFLLAVYVEYFKEKKNILWKILYIIPCFIHMSMAIGVMLRLCMIFYKNKNKKYIIFALIIYATSPSIILYIVSKFNGSAIFSDLYAKTTHYVNGTGVGLFDNMYDLIKLVSFINLFIIFEKMYKGKKSRQRDITELICIFNFLSFNYGVIRERWYDACIILLALSFMHNIHEYIKIKGVYKVVLSATLVCMIIIQTNFLRKIDYVGLVQKTYNQTLLQNFRKES